MGSSSRQDEDLIERISEYVDLCLHNLGTIRFKHKRGLAYAEYQLELDLLKMRLSR